MIEIGKHENQHRVRKRYVAKGIDEGKVSFKDHDEGRANEGGTPGKQASTTTPPEDVRTCLFPAAAAATWYCEKLRFHIYIYMYIYTHYNEQGRAEVIRSKTSSDDSNLSVAQWVLEVMKDIREETMKPQLKCLSLCNVEAQNMKASSSRTTRYLLSRPANNRQRHGKLEDTSIREDEVLH